MQPRVYLSTSLGGVEKCVPGKSVNMSGHRGEREQKMFTMACACTGHTRLAGAKARERVPLMLC